MKKRMSFFVAVFALVSLQPARADPKEFIPSAVRTDKFSLAEQISFPWDYNAGKDFYKAVACTARIARRGKMQYPFCLGGDEESRQFEQRVLLATERARMQPAKVNGRRNAIAMKFTTIFSRVDGAASVTVVPNHFLNRDEFGMRYTAPQLRTSNIRTYPRTCRNMNVIMRITVEADGSVSASRLHKGEHEAKGCIEGLVNGTDRLRYIPCMVNGVPTKMDHLYLVGWRGGWSIYSGGTR